jgi:hypothetical protein
VIIKPALWVVVILVLVVMGPLISHSPVVLIDKPLLVEPHHTELSLLLSALYSDGVTVKSWRTCVGSRDEKG